MSYCWKWLADSGARGSVGQANWLTSLWINIANQTKMVGKKQQQKSTSVVMKTALQQKRYPVKHTTCLYRNFWNAKYRDTGGIIKIARLSLLLSVLVSQSLSMLSVSNPQWDLDKSRILYLLPERVLDKAEDKEELNKDLRVQWSWNKGES